MIQGRRSRFDERNIRDMRMLRRRGMSCATIAERFGCSAQWAAVLTREGSTKGIPDLRDRWRRLMPEMIANVKADLRRLMMSDPRPEEPTQPTPPPPAPEPEPKPA